MSVCQQDYTRTTSPILLKLGGKVRFEQRKDPLVCGAAPEETAGSRDLSTTCHDRTFEQDLRALCFVTSTKEVTVLD